MAKDSRNQDKKKNDISAIVPTDEKLTSRAGLGLYAGYLRRIELFPMIDRWFGSMRKNRKGIAINELFVQILSYFMDGTSRHLTRFDQLGADDSYATLLGTDRLASSHAVKRFFGGFEFWRVFQFRKLLQDLFIWRLKQSNPSIIILGLDTTVLDNDDADKRHGAEPTYKKVKGFQPLQLTWGRQVVDAVFRGGSKHSNHGDTADKMLTHLVAKIRAEYRQDVPIVVRMDAGFYDDGLFNTCEKLKIGYTCGGKLYRNVVDEATDAAEWHAFTKADDQKKRWMYTDLLCQQANWEKARRTIFSTLAEEDGQYVLDGMCRDSVIITNLGMGETIDEQLEKVKAKHLVEAGAILGLYHGRGADELTNRAIKTFGHEQLPFKRFNANAAWYYLMVMGNNLFEAFKEDVTEAVISVKVYADTFRRQFIDIAGKIVRKGGKVLLQVPRAVFERLQLDRLLGRLEVGLPKLC